MEYAILSIFLRQPLKAYLDFELGLTPVNTVCKFNLATTTFANSITLTPCIVTLSVEGENQVMHALYAQQSDLEDFLENDE